MKSSELQRKLKRALDAETATKLGQEAGWSERLRVVTPHALALALIGAMALRRVETLADLMRDFIGQTGRLVRYKPFHNRLAKPEFAEFMRCVLCHLMSELVVEVLRPRPNSPLAQFDDILLHDGSSFAVHNALAERFPGRFTTHSPAAVELHATMSVTKDAIVRVRLTADTTSERSQLPEPETLRNKLLIADRGYEDRKQFAAIMDEGGSFLVRCKANSNPMVEQCRSGGRRIPQWSNRRLAEFRSKLRGRDADLVVRCRNQGRDVRYRMVLVWNPEHSTHMVLATNLSATEFSVQAVRQIYAVRWQVELAFKELKSYASLRKFNTRNPDIVMGLIWAALAAGLVKRFLAHAAQHVHQVATSTRTVSMCIGEHLRDILKASIGGLAIGPPLQKTLRFIADAAGRAHPARDELTGRLSCGIEVVN